MKKWDPFPTPATFPSCEALCYLASLNFPMQIPDLWELLPELEWCKGLDPSSSPASGQPASPTVSHPSLFCLQVLQDCQRYRSNIRETGDLWVSGAEWRFVPPRGFGGGC